MMTPEEYQNFIARMKMLGQLEQQRKIEERNDPDGLKKFLIFLDEVHQISKKQQKTPSQLQTSTEVRINRQKILSKYPKRNGS